MNLEIRVKSTETESKGKYDQLTIGYTDINSGQEHSYKLMSFVNKEAYNLLKSAKSGDEFSVECNKNDKGYWTWESVSVLGAAPKKANAVPKSNYETPEERAKKQVYIVRQSSITSAVALLGPKAKVEQVLNVAKQFEQYVFGITLEEVTEELPIIDEE